VTDQLGVHKWHVVPPPSLKTRVDVDCEYGHGIPNEVRGRGTEVGPLSE
jgi:hypothetical protein